MKKLLIIPVLFILINQVKSQTDFPENEGGNISFNEVVTTSNQMSENQIYNNLKDWISTKSSNFNRSNSEKNAQGSEVWGGTTKQNFAQIDALYKNETPLKLSDKESYKLIAKIVNKYTGGTMGCIRILYFEYDLIIKIKDSKYKYEITNFTYTHYNQSTGKQTQMYGMKDEGPCKSKGDLNELFECERCKKDFQKLYDYLKNDIHILIEDMKTNTDKKPTDDNW